MSQGEPSKCFIGLRLNEQCHFRSSSSELTQTSDLSKEENRCIELRTGLTSVSDLCNHHLDKYLKRYTYITSQEYCCNPLKVHKKKIKVKQDRSSIMSLQFTESVFKMMRIKLVPGQLLCYNCKWKVTNQIGVKIDSAFEDIDPVKPSSSAEIGCSIPSENQREVAEDFAVPIECLDSLPPATLDSQVEGKNHDIYI
jgi:hypothetical protein